MAIDMENHGYPGGILDHGDQGGGEALAVARRPGQYPLQLGLARGLRHTRRCQRVTTRT
jgi:hypothetical protein